ncbi:reverse transcriptase domain-containing protein [Tanacetum coccineum]
MLKRCEDTKLALNWEKSHFMVKEGIVLGHKISRKGIEVDKAKVDVISKLPHPTTVKGIRSFLGHAGFYRRFIKDFSKISRPMTHLLEKNTPFIFSEDCILAFQTLKKKLTEAPIYAPNWDQPFEIMCDASDYAIGAVLGQRIEKHFRPIHYASKTMTEAETNYTTTEKEMLAVVYAFEKFRSYLIMNKSVVYTDHSALKYLFNKKDAKARLLRIGSYFSRIRFFQPFLRTAKALIDLYEETLTLRVGKEELVYYADKSEKNKDKNFVHAISIIDFSKDDPFSGSTTNTLPPSSSPVKTSDNFEKFADELAPLDSLPPGNDDLTLKKDLHEETFQIYSNPLFEFDDNFKSSNVNPLFEENDKDVKIKSSSSFTLTSPEESELEAYLEKDSIPPGIDLTLPPTLEVSSSNPTSPTLTGEKVCSWKTPMFFSLVRFVWKMMNRIAIRKKIICLLATFLHKKPKPLSHPQEVEEIKEKEDKVSSDVPINTIVMPIRITFDNPIDFNDHFSKPKDLKQDLPISFDFITTSILPPPLLDSDSPFTAELSASITLNSLGNEDKVFKPGILVYHAIHDKNLVTLEENLKENISSGTLLVFNKPSFLLPSPEPPDDCLNFKPNLVMKNVVLNEDFYQSKKTLPLNVEDVDSFTFIIWIFLPYFPYPEESPLIFSFRSENFVFDPGIVTFHKPVPGDYVYRSNEASHAMDGGKLGPNREGPYEVTEVLGGGAYKLSIIPLYNLRVPGVTYLRIHGNLELGKAWAEVADKLRSILTGVAI